MGFGTTIRRAVGLPPGRNLRTQFKADGLGVRGKNMDFLNDLTFRRAWGKALEGNMSAWNGSPPDIRWRAHAAVWAAKHGMHLEGDFVECGVFLGLLSLTICHALDFAKSGKTFFLFDTFEGIPNDGSDIVAERNAKHYFECYEQASRNFSPFPNAKLVRGVLPSSLDDANIDKIAYLSVDLNHAIAERAVIERLWDCITPSAIVLIDDYAFKTHEDQYEAWNSFAASKGESILTLPTGQGMLIKS